MQDRSGRQSGLTKKHIAKTLKVSRITLDRVLKGEPGVGSAQRARILSYLAEHGYRENKLAQALVRGQSRSLGIIVFDLENSFYAQLVNAFTRVAQAAGYETYIMLSDKDPAQEKRLVEALLARQVDGIALNSAVLDEGYAGYIRSQGIPVLSLMNRIAPDLPFLGFDEYAGMRELTLSALKRGYRRVYYVCPPLARANHSNMDSLLLRQQGFLDALKDYPEARAEQLLDQGFADHLLAADFSAERCCVLCTSDIYALRVLSLLRERGLLPGRDYGLAGYDDIPILRDLSPRLSTVSLGIEQLGQTAARLLLDAAQGQVLPLLTRLPYRLVAGDSL